MTSLVKIQERLRLSVYRFEFYRSKYGLCSSDVGFFQPFTSIADVQQDFKTILVSPLVGLSSLVLGCIQLIHHGFMMLMGIACMSPALFAEGLVDCAATLVSMLIVPLVACVVALSAFVSLFTRTVATLFAFDGGKSDASWLFANPYRDNFSLQAEQKTR